MLIEPEHSHPQVLHNMVLQLKFDAQHSELVRTRCEFLLYHHSWQQQQQQLLHDNQRLSLALQQAEVKCSDTRARLQQVSLDNQLDTLTKTLNRSTMLDRISHAISVAKRQKSQFALLFIDLNNFKPINDQHGHAAGDRVLQLVSRRLKAAIRDSDAVSRHGGDEFLLLLTDLKHSDDASAFVAKLHHALAKPYQLADCNVLLSASIGIAVFPRDAGNAQALIGYADAAMYRLKQQGRLSAF